MPYTELGVTVIQEFAAANAAIVAPLLPLCMIGAGFNVQTRATHSVVETYSGLAKTVSYPGINANEYVDVGTQDTWGENENVYPVRVYISEGRKIISSAVTGYFSSQDHHSGNANTGTNNISGFTAGTFNNSHVGKAVYIHTGSFQGARNITAVNAAGTQITVDGAAFTTTEALNLSVTPSSGVVNRFYSDGDFDDVRVGDTLEIGPGHTTTYTITAVDSSGNYVDLSTTTAPTSNAVSWRVTGEFDLVNVTNTLQERIVELTSSDFSYDGDQINVNAGISDPATPSGPIISGTLKVSYRALKSDLAAATGTISDDADIASNIGLSTEVNPLAFALTKAKENTAFQVNYAAMDVIQDVKDGVQVFDGYGKTDVTTLLDRLRDEDQYIKVMLSQSTAHNSALDAHIDAVADPNGIYNRVSIGIINTAISTESLLSASVARSTWDVEGVTEVSAGTDGQLYEKSGRFYSRGVKAFPDFDGTTAPLPVNPLTDLLRISSSGLDNAGFHGIELSEELPIRDFGSGSEVAPYVGYWAAYGNRIRSGAFKLTASDQGGFVRLTAPANGTFRYASAGSARAYLPGARDGILCTVTAIDGTNYIYADTDIIWDASYAGSEVSQLSFIAEDGVFNPGGLTTSLYTKSENGIALDSVGNTVTGAAGLFTGMTGLYLQISNSTADDGFHEILSVNGTGTEATIAAVTNTEAADVEIHLVRLNGASGLAEFDGASVSTGHSVRLPSNQVAVTGVSLIPASADIGTAGTTWGPDDVGKALRIYDTVAQTYDVVTVTAFNLDGTITTDLGGVWAGANPAVIQYVDTEGIGDQSVNILEVDGANEYVTLDKNWSSYWIANGTASFTDASLGRIGWGDVGRTVRILNGAYSGQTYTVLTARDEELTLSVSTSFGTGGALGVESSAEDLLGFAVQFASTPGNNAFRLSTRNSGEWPNNESGRTWSVQRDFRALSITGETFITKGIVADDVIRVTAPASLAGDYVVDSVSSETDVLLKAGFALPLAALPDEIDYGTLADLEYELVRPKTKDQQAEAIRDYAAAFASRRLVLLWPDICEMDVSGVTTQVPGYHISAIIGALCSGLPPQQPMSKLGLVGVEKVLHSKVDNWFTRVQLNTIAEGGVMIIHQDSLTDVPHIRHQLTTDTSSIKTQELSVTKIIDYITRIIKQEFNRIIGIYNITPELLTKLRNKGQAITQFVENQNDNRAGRLVNSMEFLTIDQSDDNIDEVEAEVELDVPIPFNRFTARIRA